jgi:hypothetical protein
MVEHAAILRGLKLAGGGARPTILERKDQDFIPAILDDLSKSDRIQRVTRTLASTRESNGVLKLFQPVHRTFNVALVQAFCDSPGEPRLDTQRIQGAGLVVRRAAINSEGRVVPGKWEGWMQSGKRIEGWVPLDEDDLTREPDPAFRPPQLNAGHSEINGALAARFGPAEIKTESFTRMFPTPPEVCQAARKTILFAVIPVVSSEMSEIPRLPSFSADEIRAQIPQMFRASGKRRFVRPNSPLDSLRSNPSGLQDFILVLRQLSVEFDAFGSAPESQALFQTLNKIVLTGAGGRAMKAGDFLKVATKVLVEGRFSVAEGTVQMPEEWPEISSALAGEIANRVQAAMQVRLNQVAAGQGRFDGVGRQYHIRAFIRVRGHDHCPPRLLWSEPSENFTIAPWFDNNGAAPVQVTLPDATDREFLRKLKPNVSFVMPENLFKLLQKSSDEFLDGTARIGASGLSIQWICSFSIPIITLCAFIVLNIFLGLFDLIFRWLLFIKICLPMPKPK